MNRCVIKIIFDSFDIPLSPTSRNKIPQQEDWIKQGLVFHSKEIIKVGEEGKLPAKIMMTFHPQRRSEGGWSWVKEFVLQNVKNVGEFVLLKMKG